MKKLAWVQDVEYIEDGSTLNAWTAMKGRHLMQVIELGCTEKDGTPRKVYAVRKNGKTVQRGFATLEKAKDFCRGEEA